MRVFWVISLIICAIYSTAALAQTPPDLPAPGNCPQSASPSCAPKLAAYAEAYADLIKKADQLFNAADGTFSSQIWKDAEPQLSKLTDVKKDVKDRLEKLSTGITGSTAKLTGILGLKYGSSG